MNFQSFFLLGNIIFKIPTKSYRTNSLGEQFYIKKTLFIIKDNKNDCLKWETLTLKVEFTQ